MTRPIDGSAFLVTASNLAGIGAGRGRPAPSDLRRATSTAYYAVFHQLVRHSASDFLPSGSEDEIAEIAGWYTHTGVLDAAGLVLGAATGKPLPQVKKADRTGVMAIRSAGGGTVPTELVTVADAFQTLQAARHSADYDGNYDPVRAVTVNHVQDADAVLRASRSLWGSGGAPRSTKTRKDANAAYRTFLRLALLKSGGPRTR